MRAKAVILFIFLFSCGRHVPVLNDGSVPPEWLGAKIADMEDNKYYAGATIVRHQWKSKVYYYINIPLSSCMYCEVYDADGYKVDWEKEDVWDYVANRTNEAIIYKRRIK
jgi:hypothetical protein